MLELGILKTWNSTTYKAGVQLVGSLTTYLDNIAVATNIASSAMVVGNYVLVAIPGGNPRDACVVASWPAGSSGGSSGGYEFGPEMPLWQNEADFFHWTTTLTLGAIVVEQGYGTLRLATSTSAGSTARGRGFGFGWIDYATMDFQWFTSVYARAGAAGTQKWYKIDSDTSGDPTTYAIGWREDSNALKGIVHNGTTLYVVDLATTLTLNAGYSLFLNLTHGSKVEWYVNGVKKGESTNIPTGVKASNTYCVISAQNNAVPSSAQVHLHQHSFIQRYV